MASKQIDRFNTRRRPTVAVEVGNIEIGGNNPVRLQSMASVSTMDTDASVAQCLSIAAAGAELVRFTAQGVREAENLGEIRRQVREAGCEVPIVADIHFNPRAAFSAAERVDKVRINPGNFVDPGRTFVRLEYTDEEYAAELKRVEDALVPLLKLCKEKSTAIRIGVNHGSLSDRIMSRYGDTPAGMTESAMEFLRVCRKHDFNNVVISIKASNVRVMVETVRRLVKAMDAEDMHYPLHLGVTEAGDGEDGRVKSAVGIGSLLAEGVGDTIRVSLCEAPEAEVPVARAIVDYIDKLAVAPAIEGGAADGFDDICPVRRESECVGVVGGNQPTVVASTSAEAEYADDNRPDLMLANDEYVYLDAANPLPEKIDSGKIVVLGSTHANFPGSVQAALHEMMRRGISNPVIIKAGYNGVSADEVAIRASIDLGAPLLNGFADGVMIESDSLAEDEASRLAFTILQAVRLRTVRTEYIACPGCGRTMFDIRDTLARVKSATSALKGLKIGVMGCIVNGPGEMADADYGYVGAGVGKVSLYRGRECVEKNVPAGEAVERLLALIESDRK